MSRPSLRLVERDHPGSTAGDRGAGLELAVLGAGLALTAAALAHVPSWARSLGTFQALYLLAFAFYGLAAAGLARYRSVPAAGLLVFAVALAARAALLPVTPTLSDDVYRYVWEGRVVAHGADPYRLAPSRHELEGLRDAQVWPRVNHPELTAIYPPGAEAGFALVSLVRSSVGAMKIWVILHDLALVAVLLAWCARSAGGAAAALLYAWNPLVLVEYSGSAHNDPTALLFVALAFTLAERRPVLSALSLATAALIKLAPLAALPFLARSWTVRARLACLAVLVPGLTFFWSHTRGPDSGLLAYWDRWRNNAPLFEALEHVTGRFEVARVIGLAVVVLVGAVSLWRFRPAWLATRDVARAVVVVTPVLHPWYVGWLMMFEPLAPSAGWIALSLTVVLSYGMFASPSSGSSFHLPLAGRMIEFGLPLAVGATAWALRRRSETGGGNRA